MKVEYFSAKPSDFPFLDDPKTLYISEGRGLWSGVHFENKDPVEYENYLAWIVRRAPVATNEYAKLLKYTHDVDRKNFVDIPIVQDVAVTVADRIRTFNISLDGIERLWVPVGDESTDRLARLRGLGINFSSEAFLRLNQKVDQKSVLGDLTPDYVNIHTEQQLEEALMRDVFIKRSIGAGGLSTFHVSKVDEEKKRMILSDGALWYAEEKAPGVPMSIQCYLENGDFVIFGLGRQKMKDGTIFAGIELMPLALIEPLKTKIERALSQMLPLIQEYSGFFGIDFMMDDMNPDTFKIIEANIRMTDVTIPALLMNEAGVEQGELLSNLNKSEVKKNDIPLLGVPEDKDIDVLRFPGFSAL